MLKNSVNWLFDKIGKGFVWVLGGTAKGIGITATELEPVFIVVAMIGAFFIIFGEKRWGTKLTSISIFAYVLVRVIL